METLAKKESEEDSKILTFLLKSYFIQIIIKSIFKNLVKMKYIITVLLKNKQMLIIFKILKGNILVILDFFPTNQKVIFPLANCKTK